MNTWMSAAEAARALRVSRATLYAYVSRGFVRSQPVPGASRERRYSRDDVERLRRRTEERRDPDKAAAHALQWGMPILESSIALIDGHRLYYRGHDAVTLARSRSVAQVASLIWTGRFDTTFAYEPVPLPSARKPAGDELPFLARAQSRLAAASAHDPSAFDLRPGSVALSGWRILNLLVEAAARMTHARRPDLQVGRRHGPRPDRPRAEHLPSGRFRRARPEGRAYDVPGARLIEHRLAHAWGVSPRGVDLMRNALILCADHELNVSSFTARCVASAGSNPYAVVIAGLAALGGTRHGGVSTRVESTLGSMRRVRRLKTAVAERLRRGEAIDGFGHPLYRDGDPRAVALLELLSERYPASAELAFVSDFADAAAAALREKPTIDFALAALSRVLRLPAGSPLTLFAVGRTIGWIGHAIEQYATGLLIRPRAKYVGAAAATIAEPQTGPQSLSEV
jgi:citrate synthase